MVNQREIDVKDQREKENHQSVSSGSSWEVRNRKVCVLRREEEKRWAEEVAQVRE